MIDEETPGEGMSIAFQEKKDAKEYYDKLVFNNEYDYVYLVERHMEGEDCMSSDNIEEWNPEGHNTKDKTNYHEYSREECEYHNIDYDELHADDEEEVEVKELCNDCEVETKKNCDDCGGYGSCSDEEE